MPPPTNPKTFKMLRTIIPTILLGLCLSACNTVTPNRLSALETADLRFTSLDVRTPETAMIEWGDGEVAYSRARGIAASDPAVFATPEARAFIRDLAAQRFKTVLAGVTAKRSAGTRPVRLVATITKVDIPSPLRRVIAGGYPTVIADIDVLDARTNTVLTTYRGGSGVRYAGQGIGGVLLDGAFVANGGTDLFDRAADAYADDFEKWLSVN